MLHKSLTKALEKTGAKISQVDGRAFVAERNGRKVFWYQQNTSAICVHTKSPYTDSSTDCFCDSFHHTVKSAVESIVG